MKKQLFLCVLLGQITLFIIPLSLNNNHRAESFKENIYSRGGRDNRAGIGGPGGHA